MERGCRSDRLQLLWVLLHALLVLQQAELQDATEAGTKSLANVPTLLACGECLDTVHAMVIKGLAAAWGALALRPLTLVSLLSAAMLLEQLPVPWLSPMLAQVAGAGWSLHVAVWIVRVGRGGHTICGRVGRLQARQLP
jgi:hypothetical protein